MPSPLPPILDATCGSRMIHFDPDCPDVLFCDKRECDGEATWRGGSHGKPSVRHLNIHPDIIADFTALPFPDASFYLVVFDPPHLKCGETSFMFYKYGSLGATWEDDLRKGFAECFRVLKPCGTLVFKWSDSFKPLNAVLALAPCKPVLSHSVKSRSGSKFTYFVVFIKVPSPTSQAPRSPAP